MPNFFEFLNILGTDCDGIDRKMFDTRYLAADVINSNHVRILDNNVICKCLIRSAVVSPYKCIVCYILQSGW